MATTSYYHAPASVMAEVDVNTSQRRHVRPGPKESRHEVESVHLPQEHITDPQTAPTRTFKCKRTAQQKSTPRSKGGCWTCKRRKVKCDERKPGCHQCSRLGLDCNYQHKLMFRNVTQRERSKMESVAEERGSVWDPDADHSLRSKSPIEDNLLPPFQVLTNNEDREWKAEMTKPGTYFIVMTPKTFAGLPEYMDGGRRPSAVSIQSSIISDIKSESVFSTNGGNATHACYSNPTSPGTYQVYHDGLQYSSPPMWANHKDSLFWPSQEDPLRKTRIVSPSPSEAPYSPKQMPRPLSLLDLAHNGGESAHLLQHYRATLQQKILKFYNNGSDVDIFETEAREFPPLFHAMMALSAHDLARETGSPMTEALLHYEQIIPEMLKLTQSCNDWYSNGAFFTHFFLLLYELAAAKHYNSSLWKQHAQQIVHMTRHRCQIFGDEPYGFVVWYIFVIDACEMLAQRSGGEIMKAISEDASYSLPFDL